MRSIVSLLAVSCLICGSASALDIAALERAMTNPERPAEDKARDASRRAPVVLDFFGVERKAFHLPKFLAIPGIIFRTFLGQIGITEKPFEKLWMAKYIDLQLNVDSSYTQKELDWQPKTRYHVLRRLLFMLINYKSHAAEWKVRNEAALKRTSRRPNLIIYEYLRNRKIELIREIEDHILSARPENALSYQKLNRNIFRTYVTSLYNLSYSFALSS